MSEYRIPTNGKFAQLNKGEIFGNISKSLNLDLKTNPGRMRLSPRMTVITKDNDAGIANFGLPIGFSTVVIGGAEVNIVATGSGGASSAGTGKAFKNSAIGFGAFSAVGSSPSTISDVYSEMVSWAAYESSIFKRIYISTYGGSSHDISQYDGASWVNNWFSSTRSGSGLVNGAPVHLCPGFNGNLYIAQEYQILYAPLTGAIVAPSSTTATNTTAGTVHTLGKYIITWVRSSSNRIWVGLVEASSGSNSHHGGYVAEWDGTGTAFNKIYKIDAPMAMSCEIINDVPYIVDAYGILKKFTGVGFAEVARLPVANLNTEMPGIYAPYNNVRWIHPRGMRNNGPIILLNINNLVSTGVYVTDMPSGVWAFDTENPSQGLVHRNSPCVDSNDYGQQSILAAGAISPQRVTGGDFLAGASYYTDDATTSRNAIFFDDVSTNTNKRGSFITPFLSATSLQEHWNRAAYRFSTLPSGDKIVGKFRTGKKAHLPFIASITWASTTSFTSTDSNFQYASVGDEIEGMMGKGASSTAHISAISLAGSTYTITLEEAIGFSSGTAKVKVDNFKKMGMGVISNNVVNQDELSIINTTNANIQIKTEMRFTGDVDLDDLTVIGAPHK